MGLSKKQIAIILSIKKKNKEKGLPEEGFKTDIKPEEKKDLDPTPEIPKIKPLKFPKLAKTIKSVLKIK